MHKKRPPDKQIGAQKRPPGLRSRHNPRRSPQSITDLMAARPTFKGLSGAMALQQSWAEWLGLNVPAELSMHIVSVVPKGDELVVFADSAAWGVRLRYALAAIDVEIKARDPAVRHIRLRVQARLSPISDTGR
jgi:hypothetical protein